jgi:hypothetical protein
MRKQSEIFGMLDVQRILEESPSCRSHERHDQMSCTIDFFIICSQRKGFTGSVTSVVGRLPCASPQLSGRFKLNMSLSFICNEHVWLPL